MGTAFPPSPDRLSPVGGQASSGYVPERLHPPPSRSTLSCGTTEMERNLEISNRLLTGRPHNGKQHDQIQVLGTRRLGRAVGVRSLHTSLPHFAFRRGNRSAVRKTKERLSRLRLCWVPV